MHAAAVGAAGVARVFWAAPKSRRWSDAIAWLRLSTIATCPYLSKGLKEEVKRMSLPAYWDAKAFGRALQQNLGFGAQEAWNPNKMLAAAVVAAFCADQFLVCYIIIQFFFCLEWPLVPFSRLTWALLVHPGPLPIGWFYLYCFWVCKMVQLQESEACSKKRASLHLFLLLLLFADVLGS